MNVIGGGRGNTEKSMALLQEGMLTITANYNRNTYLISYPCMTSSGIRPCTVNYIMLYNTHRHEDTDCMSQETGTNYLISYHDLCCACMTTLGTAKSK